ncbi:MAG: VWA-like domain-containing protein [Gammaproteobacteria bacterium]|nr:VWA-like domain-containing protein [Gammaproteobacteria bacterium]
MAPPVSANSRMEAESARRVGDCVTGLLRSQPFFGNLALRLPVLPDQTRKTLGCDGQSIRYSPQWIAETDAHLVQAAIARVVLACALKHHTRRDERDPERWQHASQLVTHGMLRDAGFTLPEDAEAWEGMSVEEAYVRLTEPDPEGGGSGQSPPDMGMAMPVSAGAGGDSDDAKDPDSDDSGGQDDSGKQGESDDPHDSGDSGDIGDTEGERNDTDRQDDPDPDSPDDDAEPEAQKSHDPAGTGEVMDCFRRQDQADDQPGSTTTDETLKNEEERKWDEAMHQALSIARAEGKVPGQVREMIQDAHTSTMDWRTLLRRYMADAVKRDYSWSLPNRRFIDGGLYMPSIRSEGTESIAVIIDTSGSIWCRPKILEAFWSEVRRIMLEIQPQEVIVLQVDTLLQDVAEYSYSDLPDAIELKGGGGTDFRPGFEWLEEQGKQPGVCLYLTDMECSSWPGMEPGFPVAWVNWGDPPGEWNREPWGERIDMDET